MSIDYMQSAHGMTRQFIREDAPSFGGIQPAMRRLARAFGVASGTIRGLYEGSRKTIGADLFAKLKLEEAARLQRAIQRAEHEMGLVVALGIRPDDARYSAAQAAVLAARKIVEG